MIEGFQKSFVLHDTQKSNSASSSFGKHEYISIPMVEQQHPESQSVGEINSIFLQHAQQDWPMNEARQPRGTTLSGLWSHFAWLSLDNRFFIWDQRDQSLGRLELQFPITSAAMSPCSNIIFLTTWASISVILRTSRQSRIILTMKTEINVRDARNVFCRQSPGHGHIVTGNGRVSPFTFSRTDSDEIKCTVQVGIVHSAVAYVKGYVYKPIIRKQTIFDSDRDILYFLNEDGSVSAVSGSAPASELQFWSTKTAPAGSTSNNCTPIAIHAGAIGEPNLLVLYSDTSSSWFSLSHPLGSNKGIKLERKIDLPSFDSGFTHVPEKTVTHYSSTALLMMDNASGRLICVGPAVLFGAGKETANSVVSSVVLPDPILSIHPAPIQESIDAPQMLQGRFVLLGNSKIVSTIDMRSADGLLHHGLSHYESHWLKHVMEKVRGRTAAKLLLHSVINGWGSPQCHNAFRALCTPTMQPDGRVKLSDGAAALKMRIDNEVSSVLDIAIFAAQPTVHNITNSSSSSIISQLDHLKDQLDRILEFMKIVLREQNVVTGACSPESVRTWEQLDDDDGLSVVVTPSQGADGRSCQSAWLDSLQRGIQSMRTIYAICALVMQRFGHIVIGSSSDMEAFPSLTSQLAFSRDFEANLAVLVAWQCDAHPELVSDFLQLQSEVALPSSMVTELQIRVDILNGEVEKACTRACNSARCLLEYRAGSRVLSLLEDHCADRFPTILFCCCAIRDVSGGGIALSKRVNEADWRSHSTPRSVYRATATAQTSLKFCYETILAFLDTIQGDTARLRGAVLSLWSSCPPDEKHQLHFITWLCEPREEFDKFADLLSLNSSACAQNFVDKQLSRSTLQYHRFLAAVWYVKNHGKVSVMLDEGARTLDSILNSDDEVHLAMRLKCAELLLQLNDREKRKFLYAHAQKLLIMQRELLGVVRAAIEDDESVRFFIPAEDSSVFNQLMFEQAKKAMEAHARSLEFMYFDFPSLKNAAAMYQRVGGAFVMLNILKEDTNGDENLPAAFEIAIEMCLRSSSGFPDACRQVVQKYYSQFDDRFPLSYIITLIEVQRDPSTPWDPTAATGLLRKTGVPLERIAKAYRALYDDSRFLHKHAEWQLNQPRVLLSLAAVLSKMVEDRRLQFDEVESGEEASAMEYIVFTEQAVKRLSTSLPGKMTPEERQNLKEAHDILRNVSDVLSTLSGSSAMSAQYSFAL